MYLVTDGKSHFLNFLRNIGSQAILLTASSITWMSLSHKTFSGDIYVLSVWMLFTLAALVCAALANVNEFRSHAFSMERRIHTGRARFFVETVVTVIVIFTCYMAVFVATAAALTTFIV